MKSKRLTPIDARARGRNPAQYAPYPELANPGPKWTVRDSTDKPWLPSVGVTDMDHRVLYTPLSADGAEVATHEMGHVLFSPPKLPRVRFPRVVLLAVEDARVNLALRAGGFAPASDAARLARVRLLGVEDLKEARPHVFLLRTVASLGTPALPVLLEEGEGASPRVEAWVRGWVRRVETRLETSRLRRGGPVAPFRLTVTLARELARDIGRHGLLDEPIDLPELSCCVAVEHDEDGGAHGGKRSRIPAFLRERGGKPRTGDRAGVKPGELAIREARLVLGRRLTSRPVGRRDRAATEGCQVSRPHRWAIDGAIFRRSAALRGGTVLIDCSGSMHLSPESLQAIVEASGGAAVVATYSGRRLRGELRVVARGGRRASDEDLAPYGNGNVVDVPALEWLARQPQPRLWISDGGVTGQMDRSSPEIRRRCVTVVRRGRIQQVASAEEAARRLAADGSRG